MRDYAKVSPKFWTGETGQELARRGSEALVVALYLMTSPHSNMLGLYYQPVLYLAEETGLSPEGASEGLRHCKEAGFCSYDPQTKMVWVYEMASYQIGSNLSSADKRCKGIQKDYASLPNNPFLADFFDRYAHDYHLSERREYIVKEKGLQRSLISPLEAPSKPGTGEGAGTGEGTRKPSASSPAKLPTCPTQSVIDLYHEVLPTLPKVRLINKSRTKAIGSLWNFVLTTNNPEGLPRATNGDEALGWIRQYFERASANDFLMGRTPKAGEHAGWECDIDFLMTERGMKQVIEKTRTE